MMKLVCVICCAVGAWVAEAAPSACLPELTVTTLEDVLDAGDGKISFREAFTNAIIDALGPKTLVRDGKYTIGFDVGAMGAADGILRIDINSVRDPYDRPATLEIGDSVFAENRLVIAAPEGCRLDFDRQGLAGPIFVIGMSNAVSFAGADFHHSNPYGSSIKIGEGGDVAFESCSFADIDSSESYPWGAGVCTRAHRSLFTNCSFERVGSSGCFQGRGNAVAAILEEGDICIFDRVSFKDCSMRAGFGGSGYFEGAGRVVLANVTATGGTANLGGGAFYFRGTGEYYLVNSSVGGNSTTGGTEWNPWGGSVQTDDDTVKLTIINSILFNDTYAKRALQAYSVEGVSTNVSANINCYASWVDKWDAAYPQSAALRPRGTVRGTYFGDDFYLWQAYDEESNQWKYPDIASKVVDGVRQWYFKFWDNSRVVAAGVAVKHNADWSAISYQYGNLAEVDVTGSGADVPLDYDQLGTSLASVPKDKRTIGSTYVAGEAWGITAIGGDKARLALDERIDEDHRCPPVVGGLTVTQGFVPKTWDGDVESSSDGYYKHSEEFEAWVVEDGNARYASKDGVLYSSDMKKLIAFPWAKEVAPTGFVVPSGVECIGDYAFKECWPLTKVVLPASLKKIESGAFYPSGLAEIEGGENVEDIEHYAFDATPYSAGRGEGFNILGKALWGYNGEPPADLVIPSGVVSITEQIFNYESSITKVTLPAGLKRIGGAVFNTCRNLATVVGGEDLRYAGQNAFSRTAYVQNAPEGLITVGKVAIGYSGMAPSVLELPSGTAGIGGQAFVEQGEIETVLVPDSVEVVGEYAFALCNKLKRVVFGAGDIELKMGIVYGSMALKEISFGGDKAPVYNGVRGPDDGFCYGEAPTEIGDFVTYAKPGSTGWKLDANGNWNMRPLVFKPGIPVECSWKADSESGVFSNYFGAAAVFPDWSRAGYTVKWYDAETGGSEITAARKISSFEGFTYYGRLTEIVVPVTPVDPVTPVRPVTPLYNEEGEINPKSELYAAPELFEKKAQVAFGGNVTYNGWVRKADGSLAGAISLKAGKPGKKDNVCAISGSYIPLGGKKQSIKVAKGEMPAADGNPVVNVPGVGAVKFGGDSLAGAGIDVQAGPDLSKDAARKAEYGAKLAGKNGTWTFAFNTDAGYAAFSVSVDKKGKGKLSGTLPDGTKVSVTSQGAVGDDSLAIPFSYSKKGSFGFVFWVRADGSAELSDATPVTLAAGGTFEVKSWTVPGTQFALADGEHVFKCDDITQTFTVAGRKWNFPKQQKKLGDADPNPYGTKLTFTAKTGVVKGALTVSEGGRNVKYAVNGVIVDGRLCGAAAAKGSAPVKVTAK